MSTTHTLEVFPLFGALGASCSCGGWVVSPMKNGVNYRPEWEAHLATSASNQPDRSTE